MKSRPALLLLCLVSFLRAAAAPYQFAVPLPEDRRALLWIPPDCGRLRGTVFALSNLLEPGFLESPRLRATCARAQLCLVWIVDGAGNKTFSGEFNYRDGHADTLTRALALLARESGYAEIEHAPLLAFGHSAAGPLAWRVAYWNPARTFGALPVKARVDFAPPFDPQARLEGVPVLYLTGEFSEWAAPSGLTQRAYGARDAANALRHRGNPRNLVGTAIEWGGGHFEWSDELDRIAALFVAKAAQRRIPAEIPLDRPARLIDIAPESGWLAVGTNIVAAASFTGETARSLWYFDEELARACAGLNAAQRGKKPQMVTFAQDGKPLAPGHSGFVPLAWRPEPGSPDIKLGAAFLDAVPRGLVGEGTPLAHANVTPAVRVCGGGTLRQIAPDTFRVAFGPLGFTPKAMQCWLVATAPGDGEFRSCVQPGRLVLPGTSSDWKPGRITFPPPGRIADGTRGLRLHATADNGLPVDFFVKSGPAEIADSRLAVTGIPPRARRPVKIVVVAHQWGRGQAAPVEQTVLVE